MTTGDSTSPDDSLPPDSVWSELMPDLERAVRQAGGIIRDTWDKPRSISRKGRIDLVTDTDLAVEEYLVESLARILPGASFLAEETASEKALEKVTWVVDPLDGTTNFAHRLPFVAVSVGLWMHDRIVASMIYNPMLEECFSAVRGRGAMLNGAPIRVSTTDSLDDSVVATGFPYAIRDHAEEITDWLAKVLRSTQGVRRFGAAALDLAYLAAGRFDGFYEILLKPWDTAAGWLLVEEAGGRVTQFGAHVPYHLASPTILASNGLIHDALSGLLSGGA